ncbi:MAG: membrane protein insertion efficiency factor YidD [bacterium]|nr:membrane protein insertion efficiency factor YidD [bacterium]
MPIRIYTVDRRYCNLLRKGGNRPTIAVFLLFFILVGRPALAMDMPWSVSADAPFFNSLLSLSRSTENAQTALFNPFISLVKGFQATVSPVDGARCGMYPTCSAYSLDAFRRHGAIKGLILTTDRLLHEADEHNFSPVIIKHGVYRYYDPVENNDFWW